MLFCINKSPHTGRLTTAHNLYKMNSIEITAFTTLEINGIEYAAEVCSTVYPATKSDENEPAESMRIEIDNVVVFHHGHSQAFNVNQLSPSNYNRCQMIVQNKIDELCNN